MNVFRIIIGLISVVILAFWAGSVEAAPPANFQTSLVVGTGLDGPTGFDIAPDGRIFILQRTGEIKIYKNGQLLAQNFAVLPASATGDRGLIGIVFDPDFLNNHWVYFYYTSASDLKNYLVRFDASADVAVNQPVILYQTFDQSFQLHVGGTIRFGPDGKLYLSIGDNGYFPNAQDLTNAHGKILRLNKDGSVPSDNPFIGHPGVLPEIYAYGFRNPFRFQFDSVTGRLYEGDVGEATWEEINRIVPGGNYGWPVCEGFCNPPNSAYIDPLFAWNHNGGSAASVGGPVYHGQMFPSEYQGRLFFGDYAMGFIKTMVLDSSGNNAGVSDFDLNAGSVVDMKVDPKDSSLYYITYIPGRLYRVTYSTGVKVPVANASSDVTKGIQPLTVHFSSQGSSDPNGLPLLYSWDFGDGTSSTLANPTKVYQNKGKFVVQLTVSNGVYSTLAVPIVIQAGIAPTVTIGQPANNATYKAGDTITINASAIDGAGFDISDGSISTTVLFHHQTHIHPFLGPLIGRSHIFSVPNTGESSPETWFEIDVTATDTNGLSTTSTVNIYPQKSNFTLVSAVTGLQLLLDGIVVNSPITIQGVVGFLREISAPLVQVAGGVIYQLDHWSDGGAIKHNITTAAADTTYTASFVQVPPFNAEYFANQNLTGLPSITRVDNVVDFNWGDTGSPDPMIPHNHFSARWAKTQHFAFGRYKFTTSTDDGVRLYIDNNLVIDQWHDQATNSYSATVDFAAGDHSIKMEYYQAAGGAVAKLIWEATADQPSPSPTASPTPSPSPAPGLLVYDDALSANWVDWSWGSNVDFGATNPVYSGTKSISFTPTSSWAGLHLHNGLGVDSTPYWGLSFAAQGGAANQKLAVVLYDNAGQQIGAQQPIENFGGALQVGIWKVYNVVLSTFSAVGKTIGSIVLQEWGGTTQAPVYVDVLGLTSSPAPSPTPSPTPTPTPTPTPSSTPAPTPTPTPSSTPAPTPTPNPGGYIGEYWNLTTNPFVPVIPTSPPTLKRSDADINFNWGNGSPDPSINLDHFVVRWTRTDSFQAGNYHFVASSDDGIRVYVDNQLLIDQWNDHGLMTFSADKVMTAGSHDIRVEYFENAGGAIAKFSYTQQAAPPSFTGEYFDNQTLLGTAKLTRQDPNINFVWNGTSPDPSIPPEHFSVRWSKSEDFPAGAHSFTLQSDDGIRFWVDNQLVVDDWTDHALKSYNPTVNLTAGTHSLKVEFYNNTGGAVAILTE